MPKLQLGIYALAGMLFIRTIKLGREKGKEERKGGKQGEKKKEKENEKSKPVKTKLKVEFSTLLKPKGR